MLVNMTYALVYYLGISNSDPKVLWLQPRTNAFLDRSYQFCFGTNITLLCSDFEEELEKYFFVGDRKTMDFILNYLICH